MKVIDFMRCGNVIRLFFGSDSDYSYTGDNWDVQPYERAAGQVLNCLDTLDIAFPLNTYAISPDTDFAYRYGTPFCKNDFKHELVPFLVVTKDPAVTYDDLKFDKDSAYYFNDSYEKVCILTKRLGGFILREEV